MKKTAGTFVVLVLLAVVVCGCQWLRNSQGPAFRSAPQDTIRIGSWNVHYILVNKQRGRWGMEHWQRRREPMSRLFAALEADILAFQEMESFAGGNDDSLNLTRDWLVDHHPEYAVTAVGPWQTFPSTQPVFYRRDRFDVLEQGWFFFSETPDIIYSHTFNGSYPAFASWVQFREKRSGVALRLVNVHLDYASRNNRSRSVALTLDRIRPWLARGEHVVLAGDLNARFGSTLHRAIEATGLQFVPVQGATYHFGRGINLFGAIDHVAYSDGFQPVGDALVLRDKSGDYWASDHYPLVVDFRMR
jgi:endonuclease/exonuclease/phosphatase family metal-dependent hydrolase